MSRIQERKRNTWQWVVGSRVSSHGEAHKDEKRGIWKQSTKALKYNANELGLYLRGIQRLSHFSKLKLMPGQIYILEWNSWRQAEDE